MTSDEKKKIENNAKTAQMTVSRYMMSLVNKKRIIVISELDKLLSNISGACINLNQIAKVANSQKFVNKKNVEDILEISDDIRKGINNIIALIIEKDTDSQPITPDMLSSIQKDLHDIKLYLTQIQNGSS